MSEQENQPVAEALPPEQGPPQRTCDVNYLFSHDQVQFFENYPDNLTTKMLIMSRTGLEVPEANRGSWSEIRTWLELNYKDPGSLLGFATQSEYENHLLQERQRLRVQEENRQYEPLFRARCTVSQTDRGRVSFNMTSRMTVDIGFNHQTLTDIWRDREPESITQFVDHLTNHMARMVDWGDYQTQETHYNPCDHLPEGITLDDFENDDEDGSETDVLEVSERETLRRRLIDWVIEHHHDTAEDWGLV